MQLVEQVCDLFKKEDAACCLAIDMILDDKHVEKDKYVATRISFRIGDAVIHARPLLGEFPIWRDIIPSEVDRNKAVFRAGQVLDTAQPLLAIIPAQTKQDPTDAHYGIDFLFHHNALTMQTRPEHGSVAMDIPVVYDGPDIKVRLDIKHIIEFCKVLDKDDLVTFYNADDKLVVFIYGDYTYVVQPMRDKKAT
jgi:DNA polymerase III sliding clamp (beta) subunit (PCNA family)